MRRFKSILVELACRNKNFECRRRCLRKTVWVRLNIGVGNNPALLEQVECITNL